MFHKIFVFRLPYLITTTILVFYLILYITSSLCGTSAMTSRDTITRFCDVTSVVVYVRSVKCNRDVVVPSGYRGGEGGGWTGDGGGDA